MKKNLIIFCVVLVTHLFSSCSGLFAPQFAENDDILVSVYDYTSQNASGLSDGEKMAYAILGLYEYDNTSRDEKITRVEMLDWGLNEQMQGNSYTGYFVTYRVNLSDTWYALVDLTEFDSGRYEWKVIDVDTSLSEIQSMLY